MDKQEGQEEEGMCGSGALALQRGGKEGRREGEGEEGQRALGATTQGGLEP